MKRGRVLAGYIAVLLIGSGLALAVDDYGRRDQAKALDNYIASQQAASRVVADRAQAAINSIYENLRTLSLLPSTRTIARHAENLSDEARLTFQQVYNNLANSVSISEVYILPADLNPDRIDPVTGKAEEPILMFDELIVDARDRYASKNPQTKLPSLTDPFYQAEVEIYEYREMRRQLALLSASYPKLSTIEGLAVPMMASPELIICDNTTFIHTLNDADRSGIVFTVPVYGPNEELRAAVSGIILTSALEALLPATDFSLINVGHSFATGLRSNGQQRMDQASVLAGVPAPGLLYSEVLPLNTATSDSSFAVWVGHPDAQFYASPDAEGVRFAVALGYALVGLLTAAALIVWFLITKNFKAAAEMSASLERRVVERTAEIRFLATHDALTGLANRPSLTERLGELLELIGRSDHQLAVHCLDLDNFKTVNDTLGHQAGDQLLKLFAERVRSVLAEDDVFGRLGGDEFVVIQPRIASAQAAESLARRLLEAMRAPVELRGQRYHVGVSIGIAVAPIDGKDGETMLRSADIALYRAKADGRSTFRFFEPEMDATLRARQALEKELRQAVEANEFVLHYQPLINVSENRVTGFEALVRWDHPGRGLLAPSEFIGLAEDIGLIAPLGEWVLRQACKEAASWPGDLKVAVNLSPQQFKQKALAHTVVSALDESGLAPFRLELEITESALLDSSSDALSVLRQFKDLGVRIAMDDFGTGFSSLSYLRSFPFDRIKIDKSFVAEIAHNKDCRSIVSAVAALGHSLGMTTTAEGIETEEQLALVKAEGCTDLQGYLFSRPLAKADLASFLKGLVTPAARQLA